MRLLILSLLFLFSFSRAQAQVQAGHNTYALVVGIANYGDKDIPQLQYANRDAEVFAEYLQSKAGGSVPAENIQLLVDSAATTGAVYDAIYWLIKTCKKDDLVFIYFSGHGDMETPDMNIHQSGFLICYDSPPTNYVKLSLSVDYLNEKANTLSAQTNANVVLITDACHSGNLAGSRNKGAFLVGEQLRNVKSREIRITSCSDNQLSHENEAWGGGRGVFSYYLVNGLKGLADKSADGIVTLDEIKNYLDSSLYKDPELKKEHIVQTPVLNGRPDFQLANVDAAIKKATIEKLAEEMPPVNMMLSASQPRELLPADAQDYFFQRLKAESLEQLTDSLHLNELPVTDVAFTLIKKIRGNTKNGDAVAKLDELENQLKLNQQRLVRFNSKLAVAFDRVGQKAVDLYLSGDAAELEKRRYYNAANNGYDVYPRMFALALKLVPPDNDWRNILEVKLHYFTGVALRLHIPEVEDPARLIAQALTEQKAALQLENHAAYIYNELGILYDLKKAYKVAENYYLKATEISPEWVLPWSNLAGLYASTHEFDKGFAAIEKAKALKPGMQLIPLNNGLLQEEKGNLLLAEENFQQSIYINSRHYLPFERLAHVMMNTCRYAQADSFFYEADERKKGFHFNPDYDGRDKQALNPQLPAAPGFCPVDSNDVGPADVLGHLALALNMSESFGPITQDGVLTIDRERGYISPDDSRTAEREYKKAIALDNKVPLAYHYLGKLLYWQQRWQEAELYLNQAIQNDLSDSAFDHYLDSMTRLLPPTPSRDCINITVSSFRGIYAAVEDHYFLASLYESWHHYPEAELHYRKIISMDPAFIGGYSKLWKMLERSGRYGDAEDVIRNFMASAKNKKEGEKELAAFYKRMLALYPNDAGWNYKAGIFLYQLAASHPDAYPHDKRTIMPDTHEAFFLTEPNVSHITIYIPGTGEICNTATAILYPRDEGINCLLKADSLSAFSDETIADINEKIGDLYTWQGLPEKAIPHYQKAIGLQPQNSGTRMKLVDALVINYHFQDALGQLDSLYNRREINYSNMLQLARYRLYAGHYTTAQQLLDSAEKLLPYKNADILAMNGLLQSLSLQPVKAIQYYKQLVTMYPNDAITMYSIARLYAKLGNGKEARNWLKAALDNGFSYSFVLWYDPAMASLRKKADWETLIKNYHFKKYYPASPFGSNVD